MDPIVELLTSYADLNASHVVELKMEPSPLQFMRFVALNTPFVVKNATSEWRATKLWSSSYLRSVLKGHVVNVAVTPFGYDFQKPTSSANLGTLHFIGTPILPLTLEMEP
jgi:peptidyl-lysine (3S)-dioxygenase / protease